MDGNFAAEHQKMRNPDADVRLSDGQGFFVSSQAYKDYLEATQDTAEVRCTIFF